ncbi:hypothetical protein AB0M43_24910 [Longispora sp. NPDC051575]|uniref:hypothetical protein n=1 Tax=Longispora sp. NPDC051575 TaxID=3154943 RepID=UPI00342FBA84
MTLTLGNGVDQAQASVDRICPELGYTMGNVVLCTFRANSVKRDVTLDELAAWMPGWAHRVALVLPALLTRVTPMDPPRSASGVRIAQFRIDRHKRVADWANARPIDTESA